MFKTTILLEHSARIQSLPPLQRLRACLLAHAILPSPIFLATLFPFGERDLILHVPSFSMEYAPRLSPHRLHRQTIFFVWHIRQWLRLPLHGPDSLSTPLMTRTAPTPHISLRWSSRPRQSPTTSTPTFLWPVLSVTKRVVLLRNTDALLGGFVLRNITS